MAKKVIHEHSFYSTLDEIVSPEKFNFDYFEIDDLYENVNRFIGNELSSFYNQMRDKLFERVKVYTRCEFKACEMFLPASHLISNSVDSVVKRVIDDFDALICVRVKLGLVYNELIFEIEDNGVGIDENIEEDIFKNVVVSSKRNSSIYQGGAGVGLIYVKRNIVDLGGDVYFRNKGKNKGAVFGYTIPLIN
jgi:signal transduction histidine kinase